MEPPYWAILLLVGICGLAGIALIVKAQRRKEKTYYWVSGIAFLVIIVVVVALLEQFLLSLVIIMVTCLLSIGLLPRVMDLYGQEIVKQIHETDVSAPLRMRDFLTWKGWIKIKTIYGFRKMLTIYSILNIGVVGALLLTLIALGLMTPLTAIFYAIFTAIFSFIIAYRQIYKAFKESTNEIQP